MSNSATATDGAIGTGAVLGKIDLFRGISERELARLEKLARPRVYEPGQIIVEQGSSGVALFVIRSGKVRVTQKAADGTHREIRTIGPGGSFGEMALFNNRPRSATISAVEPTECLALHQFDFLDELRKSPEIAIRLLDTISQRLVDAERR
ncbi:MAG TPA: cyclic nucleotide-binding domain-containing protein [Chloroflexota bacterium]|nr:cyclic nucleotide-binding domain-containing protein [Chloroflexota bacterium]